MANYRAAPELQPMGSKMINEHYPHLIDASICYLWRLDKWNDSDGRAKLGKSMIVPAIWRAITGIDLIVVINKDAFVAHPDELRVSMLDNQLCYFKPPAIAQDDSLAYSLRAPDIQEFSEVVTRRNVCFSNLNLSNDIALDKLKRIEFTHPADKDESASDGDSDPDIGWDEKNDDQDDEPLFVIEDYDARDDTGCTVKELVSFE